MPQIYKTSGRKPKNNDYRTWWYTEGPGKNGLGYQGNEAQAVSLFDSKYNNPNFPGGIRPTPGQQTADSLAKVKRVGPPPINLAKYKFNPYSAEQARIDEDPLHSIANIQPPQLPTQIPGFLGGQTHNTDYLANQFFPDPLKHPVTPPLSDNSPVTESPYSGNTMAFSDPVKPLKIDNPLAIKPKQFDILSGFSPEKKQTSPIPTAPDPASSANNIVSTLDSAYPGMKQLPDRYPGELGSISSIPPISAKSTQISSPGIGEPITSIAKVQSDTSGIEGIKAPSSFGWEQGLQLGAVAASGVAGASKSPWLGGLSTAASMASAGASVGGPWGAAIGGAIGVGLGIKQGIEGEKAQREEARIQNEGRDYNQAYQRFILKNREPYQNEGYYTKQLPIAKYGGTVPQFPTGGEVQPNKFHEQVQQMMTPTISGGTLPPAEIHPYPGTTPINPGEYPIRHHTIQGDRNEEGSTYGYVRPGENEIDWAAWNRAKQEQINQKTGVGRGGVGSGKIEPDYNPELLVFGEMGFRAAGELASAGMRGLQKLSPEVEKAVEYARAVKKGFVTPSGGSYYKAPTGYDAALASKSEDLNKFVNILFKHPDDVLGENTLNKIKSSPEYIEMTPLEREDHIANLVAQKRHEMAKNFNISDSDFKNITSIDRNLITPKEIESFRNYNDAQMLMQRGRVAYESSIPQKTKSLRDMSFEDLYKNKRHVLKEQLDELKTGYLSPEELMRKWPNAGEGILKYGDNKYFDLGAKAREALTYKPGILPYKNVKERAVDDVLGSFFAHGRRAKEVRAELVGNMERFRNEGPGLYRAAHSISDDSAPLFWAQASKTAKGKGYKAFVSDPMPLNELGSSVSGGASKEEILASLNKSISKFKIKGKSLPEAYIDPKTNRIMIPDLIIKKVDKDALKKSLIKKVENVNNRIDDLRQSKLDFLNNRPSTPSAPNPVNTTQGQFSSYSDWLNSTPIDQIQPPPRIEPINIEEVRRAMNATRSNRARQYNINIQDIEPLPAQPDETFNLFPYGGTVDMSMMENGALAHQNRMSTFENILEQQNAGPRIMPSTWSPDNPSVQYAKPTQPVTPGVVSKQDFLQRVKNWESGGRNIKNQIDPSISAKGLYQFTDATAREVGMDPNVMFSNPSMQEEAASRLYDKRIKSPYVDPYEGWITSWFWPAAKGMADNEVLFKKGSKNAQNHPQYADANGNVTKASVKAYMKAHKFPMGGNTPGQQIEVEGGEVLQQPNGKMQEFKGPSHAEGGVKTSQPVGTFIWSDRLTLDKESLKDFERYL